MKIKAHVQNSKDNHKIIVETEDITRSISIPPKQSGQGSSVNGGELLFLALATCYCNDIYREAGKRNLGIEEVVVEVNGDFGAEGKPAKNVTYSARVRTNGEETEIWELMNHTDRVSEIQNTVRAGIPVTLRSIEIEKV